jgi:hypothetical protein
MFHISHLTLAILLLVAAPAFSQEALRNVPGPVASYARQFDKECQARGWGQAVINDNYRAENPGPSDLNGDGIRDYIIYNCMVGCSEKPFAFIGTGTPCPWGNLLMSNSDRYTKVFLPGKITGIKAGPPIRVLLQRPDELRIPENFCKDPFPKFNPVHVYELKKESFQFVGTCPPDGSCELAMTAGL